RTGRARAGTELGVVAFVGRRAARRAGVARGMHACRGAGGAVAEIRRAGVAVIGARRARRLDGSRRTGGAVARTGLLKVALVRRRATHERGRLEGVVGTRAAATGTRLGDIAPAASRRPARRSRDARRVLADAARAVAEVRRADVAVVG